MCGGRRAAHAVVMPLQPCCAPGCVCGVGAGQAVCPDLRGAAVVVCIRAPLFLQYTSRYRNRPFCCCRVLTPDPQMQRCPFRFRSLCGVSSLPVMVAAECTASGFAPAKAGHRHIPQPAGPAVVTTPAGSAFISCDNRTGFAGFATDRPTENGSVFDAGNEHCPVRTCSARSCRSSG